MIGEYGSPGILRQHRIYEAVSAVTMSGNGALLKTVFTVTGAVHILRLWGEVTTAIGSNHTAGMLKLYDQTATVNLTASGATLSSLLPGTIVLKYTVAASSLSLQDNSTGLAVEVAAVDLYQNITLIKKTGATTVVQYGYSTNNSSAGVITFHALWHPISADGNLS